MRKNPIMLLVALISVVIFSCPQDYLFPAYPICIFKHVRLASEILFNSSLDNLKATICVFSVSR